MRTIIAATPNQPIHAVILKYIQDEDNLPISKII